MSCRGVCFAAGFGLWGAGGCQNGIPGRWQHRPKQTADCNTSCRRP